MDKGGVAGRAIRLRGKPTVFGKRRGKEAGLGADSRTRKIRQSPFKKKFNQPRTAQRREVNQGEERGGSGKRCRGREIGWDYLGDTFEENIGLLTKKKMRITEG